MKIEEKRKDTRQKKHDETHYAINQKGKKRKTKKLTTRRHKSKAIT